MLAKRVLGVAVAVASLLGGLGVGVSAADAAESVGTGQGVTPSTIKLGLVQVDYELHQELRRLQPRGSGADVQVFVDDLNKHGGILGRKVEGVFRTFCPIGNAEALSACTSFTEDDKVFAVLGVFIDQSGDAQLCIAKNHQTIEIIHNCRSRGSTRHRKDCCSHPNITTERRLNVILDLLAAAQDAEGPEGRGARAAGQQGPGRAARRCPH